MQPERNEQTDLSRRTQIFALLFFLANQAYLILTYNEKMENKTADTDYVLNANDRCDVCSFQAYVYVKLESGDLLFCLHHWTENKELLSDSASEVLDETERLLAR